MYARGILFGKMKYELGDLAVVRCPESGLEVNIEFKVKGWVGGTYNAIGGSIKETKSGKALYELSGLWHGEMFIKDLSTGQKEVLFDATRAKPSYPQSRPLNEQAPRESQRLWATTTAAIKKADHRGATDEKTKIEEEQRREAAERGENAWQPKLFKKIPPGDEEKLDWIIDAQVDSDGPPEKQIEQILAIAPVLPGQGANKEFEKAKSLPSQQGKSLPPKEESSSSGNGNGGGGDLIDFGQNDGANAISAEPKQMAQPVGQGLQAPLQPSKSQGGDPVRRMDSLGNEEEFLDADS